MDFSNEAGPSSSYLSSSASRSPSSSTPSTPPTDPDRAYRSDSPSSPSLRDDESGYLDENPSFAKGLDIYSRLHFQTIYRVREEHEREYRRGKGNNSQSLDQIDLSSDDDDNNREQDQDEYDDDDDDTASEWSITTSEFEKRQEQEWVEAVQQLEMAFKLIICPLVGKYIGRRFAYWAFSRYQLHGGFGRRFFGLTWVPETIIPSWAVAAWALIPGSGGAAA